MTAPPDLRASDFDFDLPPSHIAQFPARPRDAARLLRVGHTGLLDRVVSHLPSLLQSGDLLVANDTRVIPAQLSALRGTARVGITLDRPLPDGAWHALARNARRLHPGDTLAFEGADDLYATVRSRDADGGVVLAFDCEPEALGAALQKAGALALPPYITRPAGPSAQDAQDYQTLFAAREGAVAAPTAGLHFTPALMDALAARGVGLATLTLHVGAGTFLPMRSDAVADHRIHAERGHIGAAAAAAINATRAKGGRIVAVGTTSLRLLESAATEDGLVTPFDGETQLFILPGHRFRAVDLLLTNFHLPRSTLFMLVCAFAGTLHTAHGDVQTPVFMPVGTAGTVKAMTSDAVRSTGAKLILGNTYHLMLRPGAERVAALGGLHRMMDWPGPILTDSGGFQVMSLAGLRKLDNDGVTFQSHIDGSRHRLTPQRSIEIQHQLDATITMAFDECTKFPATEDQARDSMLLSMRWAARSRDAFVARPGYGLFGIVQGGVFPDLRAHSADALAEIGFEGTAIGGLAVGEGQATMFEVLDFTAPRLPADKPRYLMGVGTPDDLLGSVARGIDMFDCVMPTRAGRTARAFTSRGIFNLRNARFGAEDRPLDPGCPCPGCTKHSRAYLHHLFRCEEILGPMLLTWHNLTYYQSLMQGMRTAILEGRLAEHSAQVRAGWQAGDDT